MGKTLTLVTSRLRVTKNKKVIYRAAQQGHKKAKESGNITRGKRKPQQSRTSAYRKVVLKYPSKTSK